ncbi:hypothetical protein EDD15DRAFT_2244735, partial [Pisolithus albus]
MSAHRVPINVADMPALCDFYFASTRRFVDRATRAESSMQLGVIAKQVGGAVIYIGQFRRFAP